MQHERQREQMVHDQIERRGVKDAAVLRALRRVRREAFVPAHLREFAYDDAPLPIGEGQTISQPYIVALMIEALQLDPETRPRVLEIGAGSGYAAAVLGEVAGEVWAIERHEELAERARDTLAREGYRNVHVVHGDGTRGLAEHAPYQAIVVAAGGPEVPSALKEQLAVGGHIVMPVGATRYEQELVRITRVGTNEYRRQSLGRVRFVPLVGEEGWADQARPRRRSEPPDLIASAAEPLTDIEDADLTRLLDRIGDARVVLLGEATHGTSEFYRLRARISQELVLRKGFDMVAVEADWPDASRIDHYVRHREAEPVEWTAFARFPTWMWRNEEFRELVHWLHELNVEREAGRRVSFHGLDLYSMYTSIAEVLSYLDLVDPAAAEIARRRYGCLTPYQGDPATYGRAAVTGRYRDCEDQAVAMLEDLLARRIVPPAEAIDGDRFLAAVQNARVVANAERYYRVMYYGSVASWNLRDQHMFDTLKMLLETRGPDARAIVWAHNSHLGDASATEMASRGEHNLGQLCRQHFGDECYAIGFGTHTGTVAAASDWGGDMEIKAVRPSHERSYEHLCHEATMRSGHDAYLLPLRHDRRLGAALSEPRLERAIGVIYRPESELVSHYFEAVLPRQFDEYVWFDTTQAIRPIPSAELAGVPDTYPFGL